MLGSYVCKQCRAQLAKRVAPARKPQWQPRATFLSLRQNAEPEEAKSSRQRRDEPPTESRDRPSIGQKDAGGAAERRLGRYSRHSKDNVADKRIPRPEQEVQQQQPQTEGAIQDIVESPGPAAAIEAALGRRKVDEAWRLFEHHYTSKDCKALAEPAPGDAVLMDGSKVFLKLLQAVNVSFCAHKGAPTVTPSHVLLRYELLGIAKPDFWSRQTLGYLTHRVLLSANGAASETSRVLQTMLVELLSVWRVFFQCKGIKNLPLGSAASEWNLPLPTDLPDVFATKSFMRRMEEILPKYVSSPSLAFCAVYLYTLSDAVRANETLATEAQPLLDVIARLLAGSHVREISSHMQQFSAFNVLSDEAKQAIQDEVNTSPRRALKEVAMERNVNEPVNDAATDLEAFYLKRMARAIESRESGQALDSLWASAPSEFQKNGQAALPARVYNNFLTGFMVLNRAERTIEVWNHMIANGVKPDGKSWVALLDGCSKAKDVTSFNGIWTRMLNSGVEPDNYLWTIRVHGLMSMGQMNQGLAALEDMGKRWHAAEHNQQSIQKPTRARKGNNELHTKTINNRTKPSIEVINGAISAIVQRPISSMPLQKRMNHVQKILGWATSFDIKADGITYNTLIHLYLRASDSATAFKILRQMETDGIAADIATHNMLLKAAFDNAAFAGMSKSEQTTKVISLLDGLEQGGLKLTEHNYSTVIDRLLKSYSNFDAIAEIMNHMSARNLVPSAHAYTSLMTYYFQLDPPAIPAIDALMHQVFTSHRIPTDQFLFDRAVEGYATHGEVGRMMSVLTRMSAHGRLPSWTALRAVLEALMRDGDVHRAREVVRDVVNVEGIAKNRVAGGPSGEARFFALVKDLGVGPEAERMGDVWRKENPVHEDLHLDRIQKQDVGGHIQKEQAPITSSPMDSNTRVIFEGQQTDEPAEDVHGFLTDDHEDIHSKVQQRP